MRTFDRIVFALIAVFLGVIALRPLFVPKAVSAQGDSFHLYFEPGTKMLHSPDKSRHVLGKVAIDLSTGKIWGFPTGGEEPYPVDAGHATPPVSHPFLLGQYQITDINSPAQ